MALNAAVYGGGPFYPGSSSALGNLPNAGFTTIICWSVHVNANADLVYNNTPIVQNGRYVGDPSWGKQLASIKNGKPVNRILFSVGSGGTQDYTNIMNLINVHGTGPSSVLYQNFRALLDAIPAIDGIDMDDEDNYDQNTIVSFAQMLSDVGYKEITFCPYFDMGFWAGCLAALESSHPGLVTAYNLQCYSGGAGNLNNVQGWINSIASIKGNQAAEFIVPGLWCQHGQGCNQGMSSAEIQGHFHGWKSLGTEGGFIWIYDDIEKCGNNPLAYSQAILDGLR